MTICLPPTGLLVGFPGQFGSFHVSGLVWSGPPSGGRGRHRPDRFLPSDQKVLRPTASGTGLALGEPIWLSVYLSIYLSIYLSFYLFICLFMYISMYVPMYVCMYERVCVYVCMHACMHACMHMCVCVHRCSVCVCVCLSVRDLVFLASDNWVRQTLADGKVIRCWRSPERRISNRLCEEVA